MILSGPMIQKLHEEASRMTPEQVRACKQLTTPINPFLLITPFNEKHVGPNSYDVTLAPTLLTYTEFPLDPRKDNPTVSITIPETGYTLQPNTLYLGAMNELIDAHAVVPWLDGRSSCGRLGIALHVTAGRADDGWCGNLTCEITVVHPVVVYPDMRIGQVTFFTLSGRRKPYAGKYLNDTQPTASRFHMDVLR